MSSSYSSKIVRDGQLVEVSDAEWKAWHDAHPDTALLTTSVLKVPVITYFHGFTYWDSRYGCARDTFQTFAEGVPVLGLFLAGEWDVAQRWHREMARSVALRWFCTRVPNVPDDYCGPLEGPTLHSDFAAASGFSLSLASDQPRRTSPTKTNSLRWRFLHGLGAHPGTTFFQIHRILDTTQHKACDALASACAEGLAARLPPPDPWAPPTFALTEEGQRRVRVEDFSVASSCAGSHGDDTWEPGWEPWMEHACTVCGGYLGLTRSGNAICVADASQREFRYRQNHYVGRVEGGRLLEATARTGDLEYFVSYADNRYEKRRAGEVLRAGNGTPTDQQIRNYVRTAFA